MYFIAHKIVYVFTYIYPISLIIHIITTYTLVVVYEMGLIGIGIAFIVTEISNFIILLFILQFSDEKHILDKISFSFKKEYIELGF